MAARGVPSARNAIACVEDTQNLGKTTLETDPDATEETPIHSETLTELQLLPITKEKCEAVFKDKRIAYSEPTYPVPPESFKEYESSRKDVKLQIVRGTDTDLDTISRGVPSPFPLSAITLGRNSRTGIKWNVLSRRLCDVSLVADQRERAVAVAQLSMRKAAPHHAVCVNGVDQNIPIGEKVRLRDGDVVSLYGPTHFAYECVCDKQSNGLLC